MVKSPAIGIDLGTTYSCVSVWQGCKEEVIDNLDGLSTTPSYVAFTDTEILVGDAAKIQAAINPTNTIFDAKRLIGRKFNDKRVQADMKLWPFKVVNQLGNPALEVKLRGQVKRFAPEEISALVLRKVKESAEEFLGVTIKEAVITVPAYFNDAQRQATIDAAKIAGLNVLRIINEPTAAALAYGLDNTMEGKKTVLIFDLGGGTFDVSILKIENGSSFQVLSTAGDTHLGGEDFDNLLVEDMMTEFERKYRKGMRSDPKAIRRLRTACEQAKRSLSTSTAALVVVDALWDGIDFCTKISRTRFESLCSPLFKEAIRKMGNALEDARLQKSSIDEVVLVGGSTRIPKIQEMLQEYFNGKKLNKSVKQDQAVARGAAILAARLLDESSKSAPKFSLVEVTPLSVGIEVDGGVMSTLISRNSKIPIKKSRLYSTLEDNQSAVLIQVYEGERAMTKNNHLLGKFELSEIPRSRRGDLVVDVTFEIDVNGILKASATETSTGEHKKIVIKKDQGRLSKAEIDRMIADAKRYKAEDKRLLANVAARHQLEDFVYRVKGTCKEAALVYTTVTDWLDRNPEADKEVYETKLEKIQQKLLFRRSADAGAGKEYVGPDGKRSRLL